MDECASIECEVTIAPFSQMDHKMFGKNSRSCVEYSLAMRRCFEQVVMTSLYPRSLIRISCTILQSDGGELSGLLNASLLALVDAGIAVRDFQVSLEVGYMDNSILLDMNRTESRLNGIVLTVAYLPKYDKFTLVTMDNNIPLELFQVEMKKGSDVQDILTTAKEGCKQVYAILSEDVLEHAKKMNERM